jgi:nitrous oxidase accessory protein
MPERRRCMQPVIALGVLALMLSSARAQGPRASHSNLLVNVTPAGAVRTIQSALSLVARGGTIVVHPGTYRDSTILIDMPVRIVGEGDAILDGDGVRQIMTITADSVTVQGLHFENVGVAFTEDLAAIKVVRASSCEIRDNRIDNAFFGVYLQEVSGCVVEGNTLRASRLRDATSGNGIHLWHSRDVTIAGNHITGHRDGIYFEFTREAHVHDNVSTENLRYGLHFMYSDSCDYQRNTFRHNGAGVAVMYSHQVLMVENRFQGNRGSSAYGLLLKEIADSHLQRNVFFDNTAALVADGATRLVADHNQFVDNGWALKLQASTEDARFTDNEFAGNTFDVSTNSRSSSSTFRGNYWSAYDGYDRNRDGVGDVPYSPVRLASIVVAQNEPALILLRSNFLFLLDAAERVFPALTPEALVDSAPAMRWAQ